MNSWTHWRAFVRQRQITLILVVPALLLQLAIMYWAHIYGESGLGNSTTFARHLGGLPALEQISSKVQAGFDVYQLVGFLNTSDLFSSFNIPRRNATEQKLRTARDKKVLWQHLFRKCGQICNLSAPLLSQIEQHNLSGINLPSHARARAWSRGNDLPGSVLYQTLRKPVSCRRLWNHSLYEYKPKNRAWEGAGAGGIVGGGEGGEAKLWDAFSFSGSVDVDVRLQIAPYVGGMEHHRSGTLAF